MALNFLFLYTTKIANVNLWGVVRVTKSFLPLIRKGQGRVVNVASVLGRHPVLFAGAYCITKFGVEAFSDVLRLEMDRFNVKVSIIEPGNFMAATGILDISRKWWDQLDESVRKDYGVESATEAATASQWLVSFSVRI